MRFGIEIPVIIDIYNRYKLNKKNPVKMFLAQTLSDIFDILFNLGDHPMYFIRTGFMKSWSP
jgi:galactose mutarotase-like enzyme